MVGRRGSTLVLALLVASLLLVVGTATLLEHRSRYSARAAAALSVQAEALARAGLEDFRIKLERDPDFPPQDDVTHTVFSYTETIAGVGAYQVTCDRSLAGAPWHMLLVTSAGWVGRAEEPQAQWILRGEVDLSPVERGTSNDNPRAYYFRMLDGSAPGL